MWFAIALAIVVLAIAAWQATGSNSSSTASDGGVAVLDPGLSEPADTTNPLLPSGADVVGQAAPDTEIVAFDGSPLTLADHAGTPLVVNFWAANCVPCRTEMPALEQVHQQLGDSVTFLGVDSGESIDLGRPFADQAGITYDLASDPRSRMLAAFQSTLLPTTVLVRADGTVARIHSGAVTADQLQNWIEQDLLS